MIIATKTSIKVMYAANSSKSNVSSPGLVSVEFMAYQSYKPCIVEVPLSSSQLQDCSAVSEVLEC